MAKVEAFFTKGILIEIKGEDQGSMRSKKDDGLVADFLKFLYDEKIYPCMNLHSGAGQYGAFFFKEDVPKVLGWLEINHVEITQEVK